MFKIELEDDDHVLVLWGQVDIENSQQLKALVSYLDGSRDLIVDAEGLDYIDSSGIACLVIAYKKLARGGHQLYLRNPSAVLRKVLRLLKFDGLFEII